MNVHRRGELRAHAVIVDVDANQRTVGVLVEVPVMIPEGVDPETTVGRDPLPSLVVTFLYLTGGFIVICYMAPLADGAGLPVAVLPGMLLAFGIAATLTIAIELYRRLRSTER